jgi:hypothetical protein
MIGAVAAIAVWLSAAFSGARAVAPSDARELHAVAAHAPSAPLPAVRQIVVEQSSPTRVPHRAPSIGLVGIDRSASILVAAVPLARATPDASRRRSVRPRRLALRYDATAPPANL